METDEQALLASSGLAAARTLETDEQALLASSGQQGVKPCGARRALRARV